MDGWGGRWEGRRHEQRPEGWPEARFEDGMHAASFWGFSAWSVRVSLFRGGPSCRRRGEGKLRWRPEGPGLVEGLSVWDRKWNPDLLPPCALLSGLGPWLPKSGLRS